MEIIKDCAVCKKQFKPCQSCDGSVVQWRRVVCCPEHFSPHVTLVAFRDGLIDKQTAKKDMEDIIKRFGEIDFNNNVQALVDKIFAKEDNTIPMVKRKKNKKK